MNIVFIGDSLTEYFNWQERFPEYGVINLGISGETVEGFLGRINKITSSIDNPDIIFIMTGINNIIMEDFEIIESYRNIVSILTTAFKNSKIIVQGILPVHLAWIDDEAIRIINKKLQAIAKEFNADYLDLYGLCIKQENFQKEYLLEDGVHLSDKGYDLWANAVESFLEGINAIDNKGDKNK